MKNIKKDREKDREKAKYQAAVTTTTSNTKPGRPPEPKVKPTVIQAPVYTALMAPPQTLAQAPSAQQPHQAPASAAVQVPPIHLHLNQGGEVVYQPQGRGRPQNEGPPQRGRWRQGPQPEYNQCQQQANGQNQQRYQRQDIQCWGCGQAGHLQRNCPSNPWMELAAQIQQ